MSQLIDHLVNKIYSANILIIKLRNNSDFLGIFYSSQVLKNYCQVFRMYFRHDKQNSMKRQTF